MRQALARGRGPAARAMSERPDLGSLRALGALAGSVLHLLVLFQGAVATGVDRRVGNEDVRGAVIGGDESEPLVGVEPLHGALSHLLSPSRGEPVIRAVARIGWVARRENKNPGNRRNGHCQNCGRLHDRKLRQQPQRAVYPVARIFLTPARIVRGGAGAAERRLGAAWI